MEIDGILFRKAPHLSARDAQEGDTDMFGNQILPGRKVVVRRKTGEVIDQVHGDSDYRAYGQWRHQRDREDGRWIEGVWCREYYTCPVYQTRGSKVYQGTIYSRQDPRVEAVIGADHEDLLDVQAT